MTLRANGQDIPVAQMGPDFLILKQAARLPSGPASVCMMIDGTSEDIPLVLPNGIDGSSLVVPIRELEA